MKLIKAKEDKGKRRHLSKNPFSSENWAFSVPT